MTLEEECMRLALQEAQVALEEGEIPVGAVVECNGRVISRAHNNTEALHDATAHAEMLALTAAMDNLGAKYLGDCTLYVTLEPCVMCAGAIGWAQLKGLAYGASDPKRGFERLGRSMLHAKTNVRGGILADECQTLLKDFFKKKR
ncbi:MAG: nucleoside deaminase [Bacteroidales bacterium]|nr:nucleoside deaminase [Bacteroidales bacterium]